MDLDFLLVKANQTEEERKLDQEKEDQSKKKRRRSNETDEEREERKKRKKRRHKRSSSKSGHEGGGDLIDQDARTLFVYNLSTRVTEREVKKFFEQAGRVNDVKLISDRHSRGRTKGFGYVEMASIDNVVDAIRLSGQKILNKPVMVQASQGEKNTAAATTNALGIPEGPCCIYISSLSRSVSEEDLRREFEPYGEIDTIILHRDPESGLSKGYAHVIYSRPEYAKRAQLQINGKDLNGKSIRTRIIETPNLNQLTSTLDDGKMGNHLVKDKEMRTKLMAKLQRDDETLSSLGQTSSVKTAVLDLNNLPSKCIIMRNMFDPSTEKPGFEVEIEDDVKKELTNFGSVKHIHVDKYNSQGIIYVRFAAEGAAMAATKALNGRWFNQRQLEITYMPQKEYLERFPPHRY